MDCVNILFLSDLHFTRADTDHAKVLEECSRRYINTVGAVDTLWRPHIVAIAGDIGFSGDSEDYTFFNEAFFSPLLEKLGINRDHVVMCPGNHDKNDSRIPIRNDESGAVSWMDVSSIEKLNYKSIVYSGYRSNCNTQSFVLDQYAVEPFQNYISFLKEQGIPPFDISNFDSASPIVDGAEYLYGYRNIDGIDFYAYNSAWDCLHNDKKDKGNLRIGPVRHISDRRDDNTIAISLVHHPQDWLSIEAVSSILFRREVIANLSDIAVHGHMHTANIYQDEECKVVFVQLPTWSSKDTDFELWQSYIFRINLNDNTYSRIPFFWHRDAGRTLVATADSEVNYSFRLYQKLEHEKERAQTLQEELYRMLWINLERLVAHPSIDYLRTILDCINIIIRNTAKNTDEILRFYYKANVLVKENNFDTELYKEVIEDAKELHDNLTQEIDNVLTRHKS